MDVNEFVERIAEILDLPTVPSDDQVARLGEVYDEIIQDGIDRGLTLADR